MWCRGVHLFESLYSRAQLQNPLIVEAVWKDLPEKVMVL